MPINNPAGYGNMQDKALSVQSARVDALQGITNASKTLAPKKPSRNVVTTPLPGNVAGEDRALALQQALAGTVGGVLGGAKVGTAPPVLPPHPTLPSADPQASIMTSKQKAIGEALQSLIRNRSGEQGSITPPAHLQTPSAPQSPVNQAALRASMQKFMADLGRTYRAGFNG